MRRSPELRAMPSVLAPDEAVRVPLDALDVVWVQLTGTLCNIACRHCFITCGPREDRVAMMARADVRRIVEDCVRLGVREVYFTGGEPMLHPEFFEVLGDALAHLPVSFLTNGILVDAHAAARLRALFDGARYSLDVRVSLDGTTAAANDPVRGRGTFAAIVRGLEHLAAVGLAPVVTVVEHAGADERVRFLDFLRSLGFARPRVKFLPLLRLGREPRRTRGYGDDDLVRPPLATEALEALQCRTARLVTADGVWTCPLLLDEPGARMADDLDGARDPVPLRWAACGTCVRDGLRCAT